ncbi:MAG: cytochrome c oxidase assembly protein [Candidatus Limnocylindrales bacterium]
MQRFVRAARAVGGSLSLLVAALLGAPAVLAHGGPNLPALDWGSALTSWVFEPYVTAGVLGALLVYLWAVREVDRRHPENPVPRERVVAWVAGLAAIFVALSSFIDVYATTLFSVHMVQHLVLVFVAAPLLCLGAPITLALRVSSPDVRRHVLLPALHSRILRVLTQPVVDWCVFAAVMWISHFSPLFDAALEDPLIHALEHIVFLATAFLFWWPVVGADPAPSRMSYPVRVGYVMLQMPQNAFLGVALFSASAVLYPHYATNSLPWLPDPLADQQLAGGLMWVAGDVLFLIPLLLVVAAWLRDEERKGRLYDERTARERAGPPVAADERAVPVSRPG